MTSPSLPTGFAAFFAAQPTISSSAPLIHGLTSPPRTDSPPESKFDSGKASVSESPARGACGASTPIPTPPTQLSAVRKPLDFSGYARRAWKLVHDPELHPKGSIARTKPKEIRQSGQGVITVSDPRKLELNYGASSSKGRKKFNTTLQKPQFQFDANSIGTPPPAQIVIWGFSPLVTPEQVQTHFRPFGEIQELDYKVDPTTGASLGICRIKYKVDQKDMMSGHNAAKKAVQEGPRIKLSGSIIQVELDKEGFKTLLRVGEAVKKRHAEQTSAREQAIAAKEPPKQIPTGPAADRRERSPSFMPGPISSSSPPPPKSYISTDLSRRSSEARRTIDPRTVQDASRSRATSPSPVRDKQRSVSDNRYRRRSPELRSRRERSRSTDRSRQRARSPSRDRSQARDRSEGRDDHRYRPRSRSRSRGHRRDRDDFRDSRRYSPRRRDDSRRLQSDSRDEYHWRRSPSPDRRRDDRRRSPTPLDRSSSSADNYPLSTKAIDEYRPPYSSRFRRGVNDTDSLPRNADRRYRDLTPAASPGRSCHTPQPSDRDEERGRSRKRTPPPRTRTPSSSPSHSSQRRSGTHDRNWRRDSSGSSPSARPPLLSSVMSHKIGGRPYIFINDRDLPVRRFTSRDLGLCFKAFHPSVYDDSHGFYIAFYNYQDARDCYAAHGDGKSFIDGYRLRMQLIDDKDTIRASKMYASPPRRKPPPKKSIEEEATDIILAELKEVFMKDVRSRMINPMILDFLDPSHHKDVQSKTKSVEQAKPALPVIRVPTISPEKREVTPLNRLSITNRISMLPRIKKKGVEYKDDRVQDRKPTRADLRPMHHQFNDYSDSEDEDDSRQREPTIASDDEDESSRPSRETTSVSTPEPLRSKSIGRTIVRSKDLISVRDEVESEEDLLKDILDSTKDEIEVSPIKRKRVVDFTSSEDEDKETPSKKVRVKSDVLVIPAGAMEVDEPVPPKASKAAVLKATKAKVAAARRAKKVELKTKEHEVTSEIETIEEVEPHAPPKPKLPEVNLDEIEDDVEMLLDLDGMQTLVRDREDYRYLLEALADDIFAPIRDIHTWAWRRKRIKSLNFDGHKGVMKKPELPAYNRINSSGCARTEGYIKIPEAEKSLYLPQRNKAIVPIGSEAARKTSRMNRVNNRRLAADMEVQKKTLATESDILRFNQLKARKKQLKFARSPIHNWGLFAMEDIEAHEMVIEYVGEIVRFQVAELREKQYERVGIGSSYLFRVDDENIIDATKTGNIARFINHCCTPNCSAKIIQVQGEKKIVIYADRFIAAGEEITYGVIPHEFD